MFAITFLGVLLASAPLADAYACPNVCTCKWKNGKQTAECTAKGLTVIPEGINSGTQVIDLSRNNLQAVSSKVFHNKGLVNLQKIYLSECGISSIAEDAFYYLTNLIELDLSNNNLTQVPTDSLSHCPLLRRLQLAHNPIRELDEGVFADLTRLTFIDLSNCEIATVHRWALRGLENLEFLKLDSNQLTVLPIDVLESLPRLFGLHLHNNPWHCDCNLRGVREWMTKHNVPLVVAPRCKDPNQVAGLTWNVMRLEDFACSPDIVSPTTETEVTKGQNATLHCQVNATPQATLYWRVGKRYLNATSLGEYRGKYCVEEESGSFQLSKLTVMSAAETDSDVYVCVAENKAGNASVNFTLSVIPSSLQDGGWGNAQLAFILIGVFLALAIIVVVACGVIFHPTALTTNTKVTGVNVLKHLASKKQDLIEMNDVSGDKEEKEFKASDKQPRHETGSSGYGSDQLTPDLVSKIVDMNGPSLSTSTVSCNHPDQESITAEAGDHWSTPKPRPIRYEDRQFTEVYPNPCYSRDDDRDSISLAPSLQCPDKDYHADRYPQNDRVRTLRGACEGPSDNFRDEFYSNPASSNWAKTPVVVTNASHLILPAKARFSPDEGYAEEALEGTEV